MASKVLMLAIRHNKKEVKQFLWSLVLDIIFLFKMKKEKNMKKVIVKGSIPELLAVVAKDGCKGNVKDLCKALPENVYCHHMKQSIPLSIAPALTPHHSNKHLNFSQQLVCEVDCGRSCQSFNIKGLTIGDMVKMDHFPSINHNSAIFA